MNKNKERFVQDILDTFDQTNAYKITMFLCALFGFVGLFFSITMLESVIPYIQIYTTYLAFFGLSLFCIVGGIGCLYALYKNYSVHLHQSDKHQLIRYLPIAFVSMIPGFIMLIYTSIVENNDFIMPVSYMSFYLCLYAIIVIGMSYIMIKAKLQNEKVIYQKKTLRYIEWTMIIVLMIAFFFTLILAGSGLQDIPKIILITFVVTFLAYQGGRTAVARSFYNEMNIEFMDYEKLYHDGTLGSSHTSLKARVTIVNDGQLDKALDVLEEFGFNRDICMNAILKNMPFYTFDEKMYYDIKFMKMLLMRLTYEKVPFTVEVWSGKDWHRSEQYEQLEARRFIRRKKEEDRKDEEDNDVKNGILFNIFMTIVVGIGFLIYGIWAALIPVNHFRPIRWSTYEQVQKNYKNLTYPNTRMIYHMVCIWILFLGFVLIKPVQDWYCMIVGESAETVYMIFAVFVIGELIMFPLYLKRLKLTMNKERTLHNYEKNAFLAFVALTLIRSFIKGFQKALCQLLLLIIAIEVAKSFYLIVRYVIHRKESMVVKNNEVYEIVEEYQLDSLFDALKTYVEPIIKLECVDEQPTRYNSQLGGVPYLLKGQDIPKYGDEPLMLLLQINFDEFEGSGISDYPTHGMLQFFIKVDDCYGCDFDGNTDSLKYKVIYHETVDYQQDHLQDIEHIFYEDSPILKETKLKLLWTEEVGLSSSDYHFLEKLQSLKDTSLLDDFMNNDLLMEQIYDECSATAICNKLGGQGYFAQEDPRNDEQVILLQLVSDEEYMMWGDYGTCHFYMTKDDLVNRRFDHVVYDWDCY
ncbi:YwqG family protein [Candidatus Stoquefichus massiliensis]|uniref:YwqG family protein n=1 Tax=Candidatus Stoquefichus massiliensis TaxID=1470350 RepID=UPI000486F4F0|nr:DUF1963 domain-containing protein [Candidatus Stoquefichus massiliensis]